MEELMIHVERIVRPIRAFAGRKLRMRQELLNHLHAALEEERGTRDETIALERAKARLGVPTELTRSLQMSVPWIERALMAKLRIPRAVERWEARSVRWRQDCPLTMLQTTILAIGSTAMLFAGCLSPTFGAALDRTAAQRMMFDRPLTWVLFNIGAMIITFVGFGASARFTAAIAGSRQRLLRNAAIILCIPSLTATLVFAAVNRRAATPGELLRGMIVGLVVLGLQAVMGRIIGSMRRPYAEWFLLDIAE